MGLRYVEHQCMTCQFANWRKTASGKMHPTGEGKCTYALSEMIIPASYYWIGFREKGPMPSGGRIDRRAPFSRRCPTYKAIE